MSTIPEVAGFGDRELAIVGGDQRRASRRMCCSHMEQVEAASEGLRCVCSRELACCVRELLNDVKRHQGARVCVRLHRSSLPSITTSELPGGMTRSPNTARLCAFKSGQGASGRLGLTGARRATGIRRRVTSTVPPRSTRAMTRFRFCWSSRTETDLFPNVRHYVRQTIARPLVGTKGSTPSERRMNSAEPRLDVECPSRCLGAASQTTQAQSRRLEVQDARMPLQAAEQPTGYREVTIAVRAATDRRRRVEQLTICQRTAMTGEHHWTPFPAAKPRS